MRKYAFLRKFYVLKYCFKTLILLRSSRKEFEKMSVESTANAEIPHQSAGFFVLEER
jgi:hypothetical protein